MSRRWVALVIAGAWLALALLIAGARWFGQTLPPRGFPLPDQDGCWQAMCMFGLEPDAVPAALSGQDGVVPGSVHRAPGVVGMGETRFRFRYDAGRGEPQTVELVWDRLIFLFTPVDLTPDSPWPRLGDAVAVLGAPERVMLLGDQISLHYAQHTLVTDQVRGPGPPYRLSPEDTIAGVSVMRRDPPPPGGRMYLLPSSEWRGFAFYEFE